MKRIEVGAARPPDPGRDGDRYERGWWGHLKKQIPSYEDFWRMHVYPLRAPKQIWFRDNLDPALEAMAIASYSTFVALGRARHKIFVQHEKYKYVEELYAALQRVCELGLKLAEKFAVLYRSLLNERAPVQTADLNKFIDERLKKYRNLLHDVMLSTPKDERRRRLIPRVEKIDAYQTWTAVMYHMRQSDFVLAAEQLRADYAAACSYLERLWKSLCAASKDILEVAQFQERLKQGEVRLANFGAPGASGSFFF